MENTNRINPTLSTGILNQHLVLQDNVVASGCIDIYADSIPFEQLVISDGLILRKTKCKWCGSALNLLTLECDRCGGPNG